MTNSRDIGLRGVGAGKGDKPRSKFDENFRRNYDDVDWRREGDVDWATVTYRNFKEISPGRFRRTFK